VVVVALDGSDPVDGDSAKAPAAAPPVSVEDSLLDAAWEAGHGRIWSREYEEADAQGKWQGAQRRHVELAARLTGVALEANQSAQLLLSESLGVDTLRLREGQALVRKRPGLRAQGEAVVHVLKAVLDRGRSLVDRLLAAGHLAGVWGRPFRWFPKIKRLRALVGT
jgi:hypothetical protein